MVSQGKLFLVHMSSTIHILRQWARCFSTKRLLSYSNCLRHRQQFTPKFDISKIPDLPTQKHVKLSFKQLRPHRTEIDPNATPVLFLHGLFGSKLSFNKAGRHVSELSKRPVFAVDLRNHGDSPHALPHTYIQMAHDVSQFIEERNWEECILVGHSMGAKVSMLVSLLKPNVVSKLIVVDNTPHSMVLGDEYANGLLGMCEVETRASEFRKENDKGQMVVNFKEVSDFLSNYEANDLMRSLLVSNLVHKSKDFEVLKATGQLREMFKVPVMNFWKHNVIEAMGSWPDDFQFVKKFDKPVLVMYGNRSEFVKPEYFPLFENYFDQLQFEEFDSGHWILQEQPTKFVKSVLDFISE